MRGAQVWLKNMHHPPLLLLLPWVLWGWCCKQGKVLPTPPCSHHVPPLSTQSLAGYAASWHKHGRQLGHGFNWGCLLFLAAGSPRNCVLQLYLCLLKDFMRLNTLTLDKVSDAAVNMVENVRTLNRSTNKQTLNFSSVTASFLVTFFMEQCCIFADAEQKNHFTRFIFI